MSTTASLGSWLIIFLISCSFVRFTKRVLSFLVILSIYSKINLEGGHIFSAKFCPICAKYFPRWLLGYLCLLVDSILYCLLLCNLYNLFCHLFLPITWYITFHCWLILFYIVYILSCSNSIWVHALFCCICFCS